MLNVESETPVEVNFTLIGVVLFSLLSFQHDMISSIIKVLSLVGLYGPRQLSVLFSYI